MDPKKKKADSGSGNLLNMVVFRYFPYWPLFAALLIVSIVAAWLFLTYYAVPKYRATATILIKDEKKGVEESQTLESLNPLRTKKSVENEMEVIGSRALMKSVVERLCLYTPMYEEAHLRPLSAYLSSPIIVEAEDPENIESQKKIYFSFDEAAKKVIIGNNSFPLDSFVSTPFGSLKFKINKKKTKAPLKPLFFTIINSDAMAAALSSDVKVSAPNKLSSVISLSLEDEVARKAKDILNELIRSYSQSSIDYKNALAATTLSFIDGRIAIVKKEIDSIEKHIQRYKSTRGVVDLSEQGRQFIQTVGDNDRKLTELNSQLLVLDEVEKYVTSKDGKASIAPATMGIADPILSQNLELLNRAETEYESLKKTTGENHPTVISIANQIERIRPTILETIRSQRRNLQASKSNLNSTNTGYNSVLQTIPEKERELLEISREQTTKNEVYALLLSQREQLQLNSANIVPDSKTIDSAAAGLQPVSPKKMVIYIAALILGLALGIAYVSIVELMTNRIMFRSEIENFTSVPVIAEIVHISKRTFFFNKSTKLTKNAVAEQFRQLRVALKLYRKQSAKRKILITSSIGGEGKSFVCSNLAKSLAYSGKKVILVDFDMRNPKTSTLFGLGEKFGLKEYLEGEKSLDEIIQKSEYENLFIIPVGEPAINPTELLLSSKLGELFATLEDRFDYIMADSAPVQPVTDAYIISEFCDTTLYMVRHKYTPKAMIKLLDENYKIKALKNLSIVFNGVKSRGFFNNGIGYGNGYGYEYGYTDRKYMGQSGKD